MSNSNNHISRDAIQSQMMRIIRSEKFKSSERFRRFLEFIISQTLLGKSHEVKEYSIAVEVFDRTQDFNPQSDPIVRIYAGRIRQALDAYYHREGKNDPVRIEIPKGTYIPVFTQNILLNEDDHHSNSDTRFSQLKKSRLYILLSGILGLIAILVFFLTRQDSPKEEQTFGTTSIEITGFENLSVIPENNGFIFRLISLTEIALSQFSILLVNPDSDQHATRLNSTYTLQGSVIQNDSIIIVTIKLNDNQKGVQAFAKDYRENLNSTASGFIEEVFANRIAIDLADEFGELQNYKLKNAQNQTTRLLPHDAVLLYYDYLTHMSKTDNERVILELENVLMNYTKYEPAWAALSGSYLDKYRLFGGTAEDLAKAQSAIRTAEKINPRSWHVQNHIAQIALLEGNYEKFYEAIDKQISLNPNSTMTGQVGLWLCALGNLDRGIPLIEEAKSRNPYYPKFYHFGNALFFMDKGDFENAYNESLKIRMPNLFWDPLFRAALLGKIGRKEEAKNALDELLMLHPDFPVNGIDRMAMSLYSEKLRTILIEGLEDAGLSL